MNKLKLNKGSKQQGIATLLILLLVGVAISAAVFGALRFVRGSQDQTTAFHAQTQAQMSAWSGVDMLYQYFENINGLSSPPDIDDLIDALEQAQVNGDNLLASLSPQNPVAIVQNVESVGSNFLVTVNITGTSGAAGSRAESRSTVQVVYSLADGGSGENEQQTCTEICNEVVLDLSGDLDISGDLKVYTSGEEYQINVDGNVNLGGLSTGGIDTIRSTKSIKFQGGSASPFQEMHANCDIQVSNGTFTVKNVKATRNICLANTISSEIVIANGSVEISGGTHGSIYAHANKPTGTAQCSAGAVQHCASHGSSLTSDFGVKTNPTPTISSIFSRNEVQFNSSVTVGAISAEGDLRVTGCTPNWTSAIYGGSFHNNPSCSRSATHVAGPWIFPVPPVDPVELQTEIFDANTLRGVANYLYYRDSSSRTRVKIKGVEGIPDHTDSSNPLDVRADGYYVRISKMTLPDNIYWVRSFANYACINGTVPSGEDPPGTCLVRLAKGNNDEAAVPSFSNGKWTMDGINHAPGVVFVEGNLDIGNGTYTNTFIATSNIHVTTAGSGGVFSLNYAGFSGITAGGRTAIGVCSNTHYTIKPADFCQNGTYDHEALGGIGNYAVLAGSCPQGDCSVGQDGKVAGYIGGDIKVEKSVFGVIKAGNYFSSGGSTKIYGAVTSLGQGATSVTKNAFGNSTEIHLENPVTDRYNHRNCSNQCTLTPGGGGIAVDVQWTRYL